MAENQNRHRRSDNPELLATPSRPPDHIGALIASVIMMAVGWGGLFQLLTVTRPRIGGELWLFFVLLQFAVTGSAIPFVRYLNVRFTPIHVEVPPAGVIVRQSIWIGLLFVIYAWLLIPRALSVPIAFFIIIVFAVIEVFLRGRELSNDDQ